MKHISIQEMIYNLFHAKINLALVLKILDSIIDLDDHHSFYLFVFPYIAHIDPFNFRYFSQIYLPMHHRFLHYKPKRCPNAIVQR